MNNKQKKSRIPLIPLKCQWIGNYLHIPYVRCIDHRWGKKDIVKIRVILGENGTRIWIPALEIRNDSSVLRRGQMGNLILKYWYVRNVIAEIFDLGGTKNHRNIF